MTEVIRHSEFSEESHVDAVWFLFYNSALIRLNSYPVPREIFWQAPDDGT